MLKKQARPLGTGTAPGRHKIGPLGMTVPGHRPHQSLGMTAPGRPLGMTAPVPQDAAL